MRALIATTTIIALALAGCATRAVVSDVNDSAVHVQVNGDPNDPVVKQQAESMCQRYGKHAQPVSWRALDGYGINKDVLFTCT